MEDKLSLIANIFLFDQIGNRECGLSIGIIYRALNFIDTILGNNMNYDSKGTLRNGTAHTPQSSSIIYNFGRFPFYGSKSVVELYIDVITV